MTRKNVFGDLCLCIGAADAGMRWLHRTLAGHPQLSVCPMADVEYFHHRHVDPGRLTPRRRLARLHEAGMLEFDPASADPAAVRERLAWAAAYLSDPVDDGWYQCLCAAGHGTAYTCNLSDKAALLTASHWRQIEAQCRTLRVVFVMRDPLTRLRHRWAGQTAPGGVRPIDDYGRTLSALQEGLAIGSWRVIFHEDMIEDPRATLRSIGRFLGLTPAGADLPPCPDDPLDGAAPLQVPEAVARDLARIRRDVEAAGFSPPDSWQF